MINKPIEPVTSVGHIVRLKDDVPDVVASIRALAARYKLSILDTYHEGIKGFSSVIPSPIVPHLLRENAVEAIEPDLVVQAYGQYVPWGIQRIGCMESTVKVGSFSNVDVHVFILDTGVQKTHPDLNVVEALSFVRSEKNTDDLNGHGTMVAGVICARDNSSHVVGVAPWAKIHAYKVLDKTGSGVLSNIIAGIERVIAFKKTFPDNRVVVNLSLGGFAGSVNYNSLDLAIQKAINQYNITVVIASGNEAIDANLVTPAHVREAITVGAYALGDAWASYSNFGNVVDVLAPGSKIMTTGMKSSVVIVDGTSFAAPHVAGACAIYLLNNRTSSPAQVRDAILALANDASNPTINGCPIDTTNKSIFVKAL